MKLAIFDFDGTLMDTSVANYLSYRDAAMQCGFKWSVDEEQFNCVQNGEIYHRFLPRLIPGIGDDEIERIHKIKGERYRDHYDAIIKNDPLISLVRLIKKDSDYATAIATMASRSSVMEILAYFKLDCLFDYLVAQEDVLNQKPSPECYERIMRMADVEPGDTIIFEDSDPGVSAARKSGATVLRFCNGDRIASDCGNL